MRTDLKEVMGGAMREYGVWGGGGERIQDGETKGGGNTSRPDAVLE